MAAKKEKSGIDALRMDVQALADAFWKFRDSVLTDVAVQQAEQQQFTRSATVDGRWNEPDDAQVQQAAALMSALSQPQRLRIVMMLSEGPSSVAAVVEALGLKTTGAAYHHLNVLINNGVAIQQERGTFALAPEAVGKINVVMMALFGSAPTDSPVDASSKKKKKDR